MVQRATLCGMSPAMTLEDFRALVARCPDGVVLLEGRRKIPERDAAAARMFAARLAREFPHLRFRSGNAEGSDEAFSDGVAEVDPERLQVIAPYETHRRKARRGKATYDSPASLGSVQESAVAAATVAASPRSEGLVRRRGTAGRSAAKAAYLIRDTMKVLGHTREFPRPLCALFYVDLGLPDAGGTGHTLRVCQQNGVPHAFQDAWGQWFA